MSDSMKEYANKIGAPVVNISSAKKHILALWASGELPILHGESGIGKTAIAKQLAAGMEGDCIVLDVSTLQPEDLGLPLNQDGYVQMLKPAFIRRIEENHAAGKPTVLLFDEITRFTPGSASALFSILGARTLYDYTFPDTCFIYAACNPVTKGFQVGDIMSDEAWRRRGRHIVVTTNAATWLRYATDVEMHPDVIDYIYSHMDALIDYPAKNAGKIFANPASWEKVSNFLKANEGMLDQTSIATMLNYDRAASFISFITEAKYRLSPQAILEGDWLKSLEKLSLMREDGKGDLLSSLASSIVVYLYQQKPSVNSTVTQNLESFIIFLSEELQCKLFNLIEDCDGDKRANSNYKAELLSSLMKQSKWATYFPVIKDCLRAE